jgi:thiol-disulfide isomerase/thioredoxin
LLSALEILRDALCGLPHAQREDANDEADHDKCADGYIVGCRQEITTMTPTERFRYSPKVRRRGVDSRSTVASAGFDALSSRRDFLWSSFALTSAFAADSMAVTAAPAAFMPKASDFTGIDDWINTEPISLTQLRAPAVLVNFWTYSCINSRRPMKYVKRWNALYGPLGLKVIGIHTPEFQFEHERTNVEAYVREDGIMFPVGMDNKYRTWDAFNNEAWPAFYLIDKGERVALVRAGEGYAHEIERAIRDTLGLSQDGWASEPGDDPDLSRIGSPEAYFGAKQVTPQDPRQSPRTGTAEYSFTQSHGSILNKYQLNGTWTREGERLTLVSSRGGLRYRFSAAKLHLVASAAPQAEIRVIVDGEEGRPVEIGWPTLYTIVNGNNYGEHLLELAIEGPGLTLFGATFG